MNDKPSPLTEADMNSMDEIMSRDPLSLTRQDRDAFVALCRQWRQKFEADEAAGKRPSAPKAPKRPAPSPEELFD